MEEVVPALGEEGRELVGVDAELRVNFERELLAGAVRLVEQIVFVDHPSVVTDDQNLDRFATGVLIDLISVGFDRRLRGILWNSVAKPRVFDRFVPNPGNDERGLVIVRGWRAVLSRRADELCSGRFQLWNRVRSPSTGFTNDSEFVDYERDYFDALRLVGNVGRQWPPCVWSITSYGISRYRSRRTGSGLS